MTGPVTGNHTLTATYCSCQSAHPPSLCASVFFFVAPPDLNRSSPHRGFHVQHHDHVATASFYGLKLAPPGLSGCSAWHNASWPDGDIETSLNDFHRPRARMGSVQAVMSLDRCVANESGDGLPMVELPPFSSALLWCSSLDIRRSDPAA